MFLIILGGIGLIWFLLPVFSHFIWNIGNVTGAAVCGALILLGVFRRPVAMGIRRLWAGTGGRLAVILVCCLIGAAVVLVAAETVCMAVAAGRAPGGDETLVVLGCKVNGETPSLMLSERIDRAYRYLTAHPDACCVASGGQGGDEAISEAECIYRALTARGIAPERLFKEDRSTSTRENLAFSKELIERRGLNGRVAIVTNEFHEYRAGRVARALGMDYAAVPASTALYLLPTFYVRELYGILYQWLL